MCGIAGLLYKDPQATVAESTIQAMCAAIVHRGPDDEGIFVSGPVGMGMRRLSIIDLEGGHQPMFSAGGKLALVFNGEIYNYREIRSELQQLGYEFQTSSDTEVLVHGYDAWGEDLCQRLNGMFAFSVWDERSCTLAIVRDHIGIKPLYLYEDDNIIAWASEVKSLLVLPQVKRAVDKTALCEYLRFGYVPAPRTLFAGISKVMPATHLKISADGIASSCYWDLDIKPREQSEAAWKDELEACLDACVKRQMVSDVPLGAFLSGGIDSSAIVGAMAHSGIADIKTYAIGFGAEDAFHNELDKARAVSDIFGTDHHEIVVEPDAAALFEQLIRQLDEPVTDTSFLVTYLVSRFARESVTVILSGVGGDELFGGYRRYLWPDIGRYLNWMPMWLQTRVVRPLVNRLPVDRGSRIKALFRYLRGYYAHIDQPDGLRYQGYVQIFADEQLDQIFAAGVNDHLQGYKPRQVADYYEQAPGKDPLSKMLYADLKTALVDSLLAFSDKMSMAASLEARVPLLDKELIELAAQMPSSLKIAPGRKLKYLLKQVVADKLPDEIINQRKQGFGTPVSRWLRGSLKPLMEELLDSERLHQRGYFNPVAVKALIDDHMAQRADNSEHIMALMTFEIWHRIYIDEEQDIAA
ncbi:MAG: asparagine synthase (glutamine-hydrolyzing) [Gammaproteobacteria bacterium]|nr:asparagine synthase (glutamine-hydrolyzing) [Gammaproteobacteria bacterium]